MCCQNGELDPLDCIFDPAQGDAGCFRPATGADTLLVDACPNTTLAQQLSAAGYDPVLARCQSDWALDAHVTHQDPGVGGQNSACRQFDAAGTVSFDECVASLTVADQRGFCLEKTATIQICPAALSDAEKLAAGIKLDACTQLNIDLVYGGC